ncbi:MAG TPA: hypothetical protein VH186_09110 [Chloroflexia bacterium]|nr:hypothetical protein [Chloroflexia bacterium]
MSWLGRRVVLLEERAVFQPGQPVNDEHPPKKQKVASHCYDRGPSQGVFHHPVKLNGCQATPADPGNPMLLIFYQ